MIVPSISVRRIDGGTQPAPVGRERLRRRKLSASSVANHVEPTFRVHSVGVVKQQKVHRGEYEGS